MKTTDKVLIGIIAGIVLLIVVALVVTITRPEPTYQAENTPEGVVHNYLLALQKEEYERAYDYLSPTLSNYPGTVEEFAEDIHADSYRFRLGTDVSLSIELERITGTSATVTVSEVRFRRRGLFDSGQSTYVFEVDLYHDGSEWKIVYSPYYFTWRWSRE